LIFEQFDPKYNQFFVIGEINILLVLLDEMAILKKLKKKILLKMTMFDF